MSLRLGVVMDPIQSITIKKDSTFAMLLEAQRRGHTIHYMNQSGLAIADGRAIGSMQTLTVRDDPSDWHQLGPLKRRPLAELDVVLMRKDPPFDMEYVHDTYVLERAEAEGVTIVNRPQALRDANEKAFTAWFPQCCPPTLIARDPAQLREFVLDQGVAIVKPLDGMGGHSIFRVDSNDLNLNVILETVGDNGRRLIMAQRFIPEIKAGDKRILMVDGVAVPYALARLPSEQDFRGNLAKGGIGKGVELSERDHWIAEQVGPELTRRGVLFAGLDVIGDYLTEINVTSPTCIRELDALYDLNIAGQLFDCIETLRAGQSS